MTRDQRQFGTLKFALDHVQIGSTDTAYADFDKHLARSRLGYRNVVENEGIGANIADVSENHCPHGDTWAEEIACNADDVMVAMPTASGCAKASP